MKYLTLVLIVFFLTTSPVYATTYATWNPSDKSANITLSNGNLTATNASGAGWDAFRSTLSKSSGKWYWELTYAGGSNGTTHDGIGNSTATLTSYVGSDANGWAYRGADGTAVNNATFNAYGATYNTTDRISVLLNMDAGTITFYKNCSTQGQAFSGLSGSQFAMDSINTAAVGTVVTANFGASAFTCTVPAGYCAGLVDTCPSGATQDFFNWWKNMFWQ